MVLVLASIMFMISQDRLCARLSDSGPTFVQDSQNRLFFFFCTICDKFVMKIVCIPPVSTSRVDAEPTHSLSFRLSFRRRLHRTTPSSGFHRRRCSAFLRCRVGTGPAGIGWRDGGTRRGAHRISARACCLCASATCQHSHWHAHERACAYYP